MLRECGVPIALRNIGLIAILLCLMLVHYIHYRARPINIYINQHLHCITSFYRWSDGAPYGKENVMHNVGRDYLRNI